MVAGILIDIQLQDTRKAEAQVETATSSPRTILIEVKIDWTRDRIIEEIRATFPESPDLAVAIAKCESGLNPTIRSQHQLSYGQERSYGIMQVHAPDWHDDALRLGYDNYQTDVQDNLKMARYIYEQAGKRFTPWSCYTKKMI